MNEVFYSDLKGTTVESDGKTFFVVSNDTIVMEADTLQGLDGNTFFRTIWKDGGDDIDILEYLVSVENNEIKVWQNVETW